MTLHVKWFACLCRYANPGDERALSIVYALCESWHADIRAEATKALPCLVEWGDARAVAVLMRRLQDGGHPCRGSRMAKVLDHPVRLAAIKALAKICPVGDTHVITHLLARIEDDHELDFAVIVAAIESLTALAKYLIRKKNLD